MVDQESAGGSVDAPSSSPSPAEAARAARQKERAVEAAAAEERAAARAKRQDALRSLAGGLPQGLKFTELQTVLSRTSKLPAASLTSQAALESFQELVNEAVGWMQIEAGDQPDLAPAVEKVRAAAIAERDAIKAEIALAAERRQRLEAAFEARTAEVAAACEPVTAGGWPEAAALTAQMKKAADRGRAEDFDGGLDELDAVAIGVEQATAAEAARVAARAAIAGLQEARRTWTDGRQAMRAALDERVKAIAAEVEAERRRVAEEAAAAAAAAAAEAQAEAERVRLAAEAERARLAAETSAAEDGAADPVGGTEESDDAPHVAEAASSSDAVADAASDPAADGPEPAANAGAAAADGPAVPDVPDPSVEARAAVARLESLLEPQDEAIHGALDTATDQLSVEGHDLAAACDVARSAIEACDVVLQGEDVVAATSEPWMAEADVRGRLGATLAEMRGIIERASTPAD